MAYKYKSINTWSNGVDSFIRGKFYDKIPKNTDGLFIKIEEEVKEEKKKTVKKSK